VCGVLFRRDVNRGHYGSSSISLLGVVLTRWLTAARPVDSISWHATRRARASAQPQPEVPGIRRRCYYRPKVLGSVPTNSTTGYTGNSVSIPTDSRYLGQSVAPIRRSKVGAERTKRTSTVRRLRSGCWTVVHAASTEQATRLTTSLGGCQLLRCGCVDMNGGSWKHSTRRRRQAPRPASVAGRAVGVAS